MNSPSNSNENTASTTKSGRKSRSKWRAIGAAAAVFTIAAAGTGFYALSDDTPSAYATVNAAASETGALDTGRVVHHIDLREATDNGVANSGSIVEEHRFENGDYSETHTSDVNGESSTISSVSVDGKRYLQASFVGDGSAWIDTTAAPEDADDNLLGFAGNDVSVERVIAFVEAAENVTKTASDDGSSTYTATVSTEDLGAINLDEMPAGFALIAEDLDQLPESFDLTMVVENGALTSFAYDLVGDYTHNDEVGYIDATVTTTYTEMGEAQNITAPPADQLVAPAEFGSLAG